MADLAALAARGMPPTGRGVYLRNSVEAGRSVSPSFVAVNGSRGDSIDQARAFGGAWLYSGPDHWRPESWREGLAALIQRRAAAIADGVAIHGLIADPEAGWGDLSAAGLNHEATALGTDLRELAAEIRIGVTSVPFWPGRGAAMTAGGDALWWSPQIYGRTSQAPEELRVWWEMWASAVGPQHCIPSIAGWQASDLHRTAQGYRDYLAMLPAAAGSIAWLGTDAVPDHIAAALSGYEPGGSAIGTAMLAVRNALLRPAAIAIGVALLVLVGLVAVGLGVVKR